MFSPTPFLLHSTLRQAYQRLLARAVPKLEADGKWRVSYEVIGNPPNVSVPTHWAKVILTAQGGMPGEPGVQTSLGAFAMPNAVIPDEDPLTKYIVPVEAVEKAGE